MSYLDTRELEDRITELEDEADDEGLDEADQEELDELLAMRDSMSEWQYGETLIPEDEFKTYARETASELGIVSDMMDAWPFTCIDWDSAAEQLKQDYTEYTYQGTTYYARG